MAHKTLKQHALFDGTQGFYKHTSKSTATEMEYAVYLPPAAKGGRVPALMYLSGLTCTAENFTTKAGAQRVAAELGVALIMPDTSPRGAGIEGEDESYDFGTGAGFYVNATTAEWADHYRMYDYVLEELPKHIAEHFPIDTDRLSVSGHSMGGHGALVLAFKNPDRFRSVSAFSPICHPTQVPWGKKAFSGYLGDDEIAWRAYDAVHLAATTSWNKPVLVDQGLADDFLERELKPETLERACAEANIPLKLRRHEGYDHSYYFIATFAEDHVRHHASALR